MDSKKMSNEIVANSIISQLKKRNIDGEYFDSIKALQEYFSTILSPNKSIAFGGSQTLNEIGILTYIQEQALTKSYTLIDRSSALNEEDQRILFSKTVLADYYLMSSNAITISGELVNIDGTGNRISALIHGPKQVYLFIGMNKVVSSLDSAIERIRLKACPPNATRLNRNTPCKHTGICNECLSKDCMCNHILITRHSGQEHRIKVFLINDSLGY